MGEIPKVLPAWCVAGARFRLHRRLYHVHGVVGGIAVLKEWWPTKRRWNYTAESEAHFWAAKDYIKDVKVPRHP